MADTKKITNIQLRIHPDHKAAECGSDEYVAEIIGWVNNKRIKDEGVMQRLFKNSIRNPHCMYVIDRFADVC